MSAPAPGSPEWVRTPCIAHGGALDAGGYGITWADGNTWRAHRLAYVRAKGPIPDGLVLDHLCRNRACVNPDHLEPVTDRVNILRGTAPSAANAAKTHCVRGHEFTPDNTQPDGRGRHCKTCQREREQSDAYRARRAAYYAENRERIRARQAATARRKREARDVNA